MNVNLFALTGFGNEALYYLHRSGLKIKGLYTRKEIGKYPYFEVIPIYDIAQELNIPTYFIETSGPWSIHDQVDLNLICTFHRIFKQEHFKKGAININVHPALLPKYPGKNPFLDMMHDRVDHIGITVHEMTERIDSGNVLVQLEYPHKIDSESNLRKSLSEHIKEALELTFQEINNATNRTPTK